MAHNTTASVRAALAHMVAIAAIVNVLAAVGLGFAASPATAQAKPAAARTIRIVAFGDSLTAGYQLAPRDAFPAQLERALKARGYGVEVINAGVSGDTTAAGLDRLKWSVPEGIDAAIVEFGANDALRGLDPGKARENLDRIIAALKSGGADVLIAGMVAPKSYGESYVAKFDSIYPDLAKKHNALLYPFFLEGVALKPKLSLSDGLHPNAAGVGEIVKNILPSVEELIARVARRFQAKSGG